MTMPLRLWIVELLEHYRLPLQDEKALQEAIGEVFINAGLSFRREVRLSPCDIVDFMVDGVVPVPSGGSIAVEVKIKGARRAIFRQLERYASYEDVAEIVLASNVVMGLPETIAGKPAALAQLGRGWL